MRNYRIILNGIGVRYRSIFKCNILDIANAKDSHTVYDEPELHYIVYYEYYNPELFIPKNRMIISEVVELWVIHLNGTIYRIIIGLLR